MFDKFFKMDNPLWDSMGRIFDVFILNTLWLLCCLPVFTIGPSTTALFYAMIHLVRGDDRSVSGQFFRSFKQNLKQGMLLGIPLTAVGAFLALDVSLCYHSGTGVYTFFMVFFAVLFLLWAGITLYAFPLLAKFDKKNTAVYLWAYGRGGKHLAKTLLMLFALAAAIWICRIIPGLIFIAFCLVFEFQATWIAGILKPYLPETPTESHLKPLSFLEEGQDKGVPDEE